MDGRHLLAFRRQLKGSNAYTTRRQKVIAIRSLQVLDHWRAMSTGVHTPKVNDAYSPIFETCFRVKDKFSQWPFSQKSSVYPPEFPNEFLLIIYSKLVTPPTFAKCTHSSAISDKLLHFPSIFATFIHPPIFVQFKFLDWFTFFCSPLTWPWCIYASCVTRPGRLWQCLTEARRV